MPDSSGKAYQLLSIRTTYTTILELNTNLKAFSYRLAGGHRIPIRQPVSCTMRV